jgi:hypothetical protein
MPLEPTDNLRAQVRMMQAAGCPACRSRVVVVRPAPDRADLTCIEPGCTWSAHLIGRDVADHAAVVKRVRKAAGVGSIRWRKNMKIVGEEAQAVPAGPVRPGKHQGSRRPPCQLCCRLATEGGLCERHWIAYRHDTRLDNPRPHSLDWAARRVSEPKPTPLPPVALVVKHPCPCGCGRLFTRTWDKGNLCKHARDKWRWYLKGGGQMDQMEWLKAGQPTAMQERRDAGQPMRRAGGPHPLRRPMAPRVPAARAGRPGAAPRPRQAPKPRR